MSGAAAARAALSRLAWLSSGLGLAGAAASACLYTVDGGQRAVVWHRFRGGIQTDVVGEGLHFRIPWVEVPTIFDVRLRPRIIATRTGTKDLQTVQISLRVLSRPLSAKLPEIMVNLGEDWDERVLPSIVNEVLKATVAQYDAEQLLTERESVSRKIRVALEKRASEFNIILDDVSITHLMFSKEFTTAIENKQVAQQDAERSKFVVAKAEQEKLAAIILAEGEGEAAGLISEALKAAGSGAIEVKRIDAAREIAETLSHSRNVVYLPSGNNMMMGLPPVARAPPPMQ